jgi:hypothetical protein
LGKGLLLQVSTLLKPIKEVDVNSQFHPKEVKAKIRLWNAHIIRDSEIAES